MISSIRRHASRAVEALLPRATASAMCETVCWTDQVTSVLCADRCIYGSCKTVTLRTYYCG
ncbi:hypothetical protein PV703_10085 [Streptomyces sp. ME01-24h]|nr:hypothetical protein [Streptomyces sp. ME01-24h]